MKAVGLLSFISGLSVIHASTYCYDYLSNSGCYDTAISDDYVGCYGYGSCYSTEITASASVQCDGYFACSYSTSIESTGSSVYCDGNRGCYYSNIEATYDVYCGAKYACYYATINAGDDVMVEAKYAAYRATIEATDDVYCDAEYGCYYADITSGSQVWIDAKFGASYSDISALYVYVYGSYGLYSADVISVSGSSLRVYLFGYNSGYYANIYAFETSNTYDVYIYCYCDTSCRYLDVYHYGALSKVYVYPTNCKDYEGTTNPDGVYCPSFTASTSITKEEHSTMRQKQVAASDDFDKFNKEAEEPRLEGEKAREKSEKEAEEIMAKADKSGKEGDKIFANVGFLEGGRSAMNMTTIYGMMISAFLTFIMMSCYSRYKEQGAKYDPLL